MRVIIVNLIILAVLSGCNKEESSKPGSILEQTTADDGYSGSNVDAVEIPLPEEQLGEEESNRNPAIAPGFFVSANLGNRRTN